MLVCILQRHDLAFVAKQVAARLDSKFKAAGRIGEKERGEHRPGRSRRGGGKAVHVPEHKEAVLGRETATLSVLGELSMNAPSACLE